MLFLTSIVSGLGGLIGVVKNFLDLRIALKDLFKKDIPLNKAFSEISKKEEKVLIDLYKTIEMGKDLMGRIYKKLAIKYAIAILSFFLLLIAGFYLLQIAHLFIPKPSLIVCCSILTYFLFTMGFPIPIKYNISFFQGEELAELLKRTNVKTHEVYELLNERVSSLRRIFGLVSWLSPAESKYLQHYLDICSLKDTLEMYWIDKKIEETKTYVLETAQFRATFEDTLANIIRDIVDKNEQVEQNVGKITNHIKNAGLERFLLIFNESFFHEDFQTQYELYRINGIKKIINQYW